MTSGWGECRQAMVSGLIGVAWAACGLPDAAGAESSLTTESVIRLMEQSDFSDSHSVHGDGEMLFQRSCTQCHDAERATSKRKSLDAWRVTVRRMADKSGATIADHEVEPIAQYLASLYPAAGDENALDKPMDGMRETMADSSVALNAEVSLIWRDGEAIQQNNGFYPDVWFGGEWRPENSPFSARVTACTSCHETGGGGLSLELVEGSFTADLVHLLGGVDAKERSEGFDATVKAGRFIVPFGAFSETVHPGSFRTMTAPLMFNMGRRVGPEEFLPPVLPMPYADEGADLRLIAQLPFESWVALDLYAVNGLQTDFYSSRGYSDNNDNVALGGRATVGNAWVRVGASHASGEMQFTGSPTQDYSLFGVDATGRFRDWIRVYYEYAARKEDTLPMQESEVEGHVGEVEALLWQRPRIALLVRCDTLDRTGVLGEAFTERFTWGPVVTLPGGSVLIANHEHWKFDTSPGNEDVYGFRWVVAF